MTEKHEYLIGWFKSKGTLPDTSSNEIINMNIFEVGLIDSLEVIFLITDLEERFNFKFNENHFQDRRFVSISGISEIVEEILNSSKP